MVQVQTLLDVYKFMIASRESDIVEAELVNSGEANFLASSKGHEGSVILSLFLQPTDYLHCHYRDKALMLARGITNEMFFYCALCKHESHSRGRQMVSHMSAPELNILSIVGPVGNNALQSAGIAMTIKNGADKPIVLCGIGDGTSQQGEVMEALAQAKRDNLPVLFFIHDNNYAISTPTAGKTFYSFPDGTSATSFYNIPITYLDGRYPLMQLDKLEQIITLMRSNREPQIIVFKIDRLDNHSNADNQKLYRNSSELATVIDPIVSSEEYLLQHNISLATLQQVKLDSQQLVRQAVITARQGTQPQAIFDAMRPLPPMLQKDSKEYRGDFANSQRITMLEALKRVFDYHLKTNPKVCLMGEDIEDKKGDVFGITRGLSTAYPGRVINSVLSESTIVGVCSGMALAGMTPVAFIQFADFMPLAYNQIFCDIATMYWRTDGGWQTPVIIFAACGGYRPGLGPFHSQTNEATFAHIPGLDVYMPSNAADAVGLLNAAFTSKRPSVFLYPKKLLNNSSLLDTTSPDIETQIIPIGKARMVQSGNNITLVGWGNTIALCVQAGNILETVGMTADIIDLRTIMPYDIDTILASVNRTGNLIVVHEDNITCGMGGEIIARVIENTHGNIKCRRVARSDTYTPCNYINQLQVLPGSDKILVEAAALLNLDIQFTTSHSVDDSIYIVDVIGASPSDESVIINKLHIQIGSIIKSGDILVDIEASKSAGEILSPHSGVVKEIFVTDGQKALVGSPLLSLELALGSVKAVSGSTTKITLTKKSAATRKIDSVISHTPTITNNQIIGMSIPVFQTGSRKVSNQEILTNFPDRNQSNIEKLTGITQRFWLTEQETIIDIAVQVAHKALKNNNLHLGDISSIICATSSPEKYQSPSMACLILAKLYAIYGEHSIPAYDVNAACSGYLYALDNACNYLHTRPNARVLLITAENLSSRLNMQDFSTAFLFGDAATATIIYGSRYLSQSVASIDRLNLSAMGENGDVLNIPLDVNAGIHLNGQPLFNMAVKSMSLALHQCCNQSNIELQDIAVIVPHQANQRITTAIEHKLKLSGKLMYSNIALYGNTSSCTIPIGLAEVIPQQKSQSIIGLCAFGAGFTIGAGLLRIL